MFTSQTSAFSAVADSGYVRSTGVAHTEAGSDIRPRPPMDIVANANLLSIVLAKISAASSGAGVDLGQLVMEKSHPSVRVPAEASRPAWQAPPTRVALRLRTLVAVAPLAPGRHLDFARERRGNQLAGDLEPVTPDHIDDGMEDREIENLGSLRDSGHSLQTRKITTSLTRNHN